MEAKTNIGEETCYVSAVMSYVCLETRYGLTTIDHCSTAMNYWLAAINYGLAAINYWLTAMNYWLTAMNYLLTERKL